MEWAGGQPDPENGMAPTWPQAHTHKKHEVLSICASGLRGADQNRGSPKSDITGEPPSPKHPHSANSAHPCS
eukprot:15470511-Alexandrium_andersonii.AAC.1